MMQNRGAERSTRLFLLVVILFFAITLVLYFMKRSELLAFQEELVISKVNYELTGILATTP